MLDKVIKSSENKNIKPFDLFEKWEYEERQSKYVLMVKRCMSFIKLIGNSHCGMEILSSFGQPSLVDIDLKQNLFREYLMQWNYSKVFNLKIDITSHTGFIYLFLRILSFTLNSLSFLVDKKFLFNILITFLDMVFHIVILDSSIFFKKK